MQPVEEKHQDVLQSIEATIVGLYRQDRGLIDSEVGDALDALIRQYKWEIESRGTPKARLFGRSPRVHEAVRKVCEGHLGRETPGTEGSKGQLVPLPLDEVLQCLQRIRSSVKLWTKDFGRQGYLNYVSQFIPPGLA